MKAGAPEPSSVSARRMRADARAHLLDESQDVHRLRQARVARVAPLLQRLNRDRPRQPARALDLHAVVEEAHLHLLPRDAVVAVRHRVGHRLAHGLNRVLRQVAAIDAADDAAHVHVARDELGHGLDERADRAAEFGAIDDQAGDVAAVKARRLDLRLGQEMMGRPAEHEQPGHRRVPVRGAPGAVAQRGQPIEPRRHGLLVAGLRGGGVAAGLAVERREVGTHGLELQIARAGLRHEGRFIARGCVGYGVGTGWAGHGRSDRPPGSGLRDAGAPPRSAYYSTGCDHG